MAARELKNALLLDRPADFWKAVLAGRLSLMAVHAMDPMQRVALVRAGVPSILLVRLAEKMAISKEQLYATIGVPRATASRKVREQKTLNPDESERLLGIARLVGQVESMVRDSGNAEDFDAAKWVAAWLQAPQAALGGQRPAELMDTAEGRELVSDLLARMQSGAYA
jgi:putative toxin-antitoxin system antitoxin component (TIGR02293 family)